MAAPADGVRHINHENVQVEATKALASVSMSVSMNSSATTEAAAAPVLPHRKFALHSDVVYVRILMYVWHCALAKRDQ